MLLVIFLIVWPFSFIWLYIDSGSHFSIFYVHFAFLCSNASIVLFLITSLFKLYGQDSKEKTTLRQKTFVTWNFCGFAAHIGKINTIEKLFKSWLVEKQCKKNSFFISCFPGAGMVKTTISFRNFFCCFNTFVMRKKW